jgi:hypothetical protein
MFEIAPIHGRGRPCYHGLTRMFEIAPIHGVVCHATTDQTRIYGYYELNRFELKPNFFPSKTYAAKT